jgi:hypothetical protein
MYHVEVVFGQPDSTAASMNPNKQRLSYTDLQWYHGGPAKEVHLFAVVNRDSVREY